METKKMNETNPAIQLIADERKRQIEVLGYDCENDSQYNDSQLAKAAAIYAIPIDWRGDFEDPGEMANDEGVSLVEAIWPWDKHSFKPEPDNRIRELVKAGALIVAEIERLQFLESEIQYVSPSNN